MLLKSSVFSNDHRGARKRTFFTTEVAWIITSKLHHSSKKVHFSSTFIALLVPSKKKWLWLIFKLFFINDDQLCMLDFKRIANFFFSKYKFKISFEIVCTVASLFGYFSHFSEDHFLFPFHRKKRRARSIDKTPRHQKSIIGKLTLSFLSLWLVLAPPPPPPPPLPPMLLLRFLSKVFWSTKVIH